MIDPKNLEKEILAALNASVREAELKSSAEAIELLKETLRSDKAKTFVNHMNQIFKNLGMEARVEDPSPVADNLKMEGTEGTVMLTEGEDQWFRSNKLYGSDMLGEIGFKYTSET